MEENGEIDINFDEIFCDFVEIDDLKLDLFEESSSPVSDQSEMISELEKFLMEDAGEFAEVDEPLSDDFFADVFSTAAEEEIVDSPGKSDVTDEGSKEEEEIGDRCKKRKRQMKNRESAMKSRERKKMYVKELEMKSKLMALEVKRLQHAFHCCAAENMALRQSLTKPKPALARPQAVQESAVLIMESLLLGSLYWLVSIVCLFLVPAAPLLVSGVPTNLERAVEVKEVGSEEGTWSEPELILERRRCRALRTRMKAICSSLLYLY